jgi:O-antigen/teichoic acid export membrane protein
MTAQTPGGEPAMDRAQLQDRALRGASWTMIHTLVSLPVAFGANLVLARLLGVGDYGRLAFLTVLMTVATGIVELGLNSAVIQFSSRAHAAGRVEDVRLLLSASQGFRLMVVAPLLTLLVVATADVDARSLALAVVFGIWVPAALSGALVCIIIESKSDSSAKLAILTNVLLQLVVITVAYFVPTADAVWAARLIASGVMVAFYLGPISATYRRAVVRPSLPRGFPPGFWRFALPTGLSSLIGTLALSRTEVFFLTWLSTPEAVGLFALAFGLAAHVFAPAQALIGPLIPAVSGLYETDKRSVVPAFERVVRASSTLIALACGCGLPAFALLVAPFYGSQFAEAAPLLLTLGVAGALLAAGGPVTAFTLGRLSSRDLLSSNVLALAVNVGLAISLIPLLDVWGAVVANVAGAVSRLGLLVSREVRALGISWASTIRHVTPTLLSMPIAVVVWFAGTVAPGAPGAVAPAMMVLGLVLLLATMRMTRTGITPADNTALLRVLPQALQGRARPFLLLLTRRA